MKKELLLSLSVAAALTASSSWAADWQDASDLAPEPPPEELLAAAAAAAAPGAIAVAQATTTAPTPAPAPKAAVEPAPTPAQIDVQPAPVSAPPDVIKSVLPPPPPVRMAKASTYVLHAAILRSRPTTKGSGDPVAADTRVRMESSVTNGEGTWWFVTAPGVGGGWLLEKELGDPQN